MSMQGYAWDLEERTEDALVAHIKAACSEVAMVIAARTITKAQYPLVVVENKGSANHTDDGEFNGRRVISIEVTIATEAVNQLGESGSAESLRTARAAHRIIKSSVIGALAGVLVHDELNALGAEGISFSMCAMGEQTPDQGDGMITTIQQLRVIAQPTEV